MSDETSIVERLRTFNDRQHDHVLWRLQILAAASEAAAEIERLQQELKEARERENSYRITLERLDREESTVRFATIEECARVVEAWQKRFVSPAIEAHETRKAWSAYLAKAIRSIDGGGK